jgi:glutaminyl-peptide cyclotransferase
VTRSRRIEDDHMPFLQVGIPAVDVIDLDYGPLNLYWHTRSDTVDKCSPPSLGIVGDTVLDALEASGTPMEPGGSTATSGRQPQ